MTINAFGIDSERERGKEINHGYGWQRTEEEEEKREWRIEKERREFLLVVMVLVLLLLLEIAGIIIAIIAVCTKRTFFPPPLCVGDGNGSVTLSLCFHLTKLPKNIVSKKVLAIKGKTPQCLLQLREKKLKIVPFVFFSPFSSFPE